MSKAPRTGNPVPQAAPWGAAPNFVGDDVEVKESGPDIVEPFPSNVDTTPKWTPEAGQVSPFGGEVARKSPFAPPPKPKVEVKIEIYPLAEGDPSWLELVNFVQKHGEFIIQARYPHPRGECVDTIYRGVTVFAHPTTQVRHVKHGWIDWKDAIY